MPVSLEDVQFSAPSPEGGKGAVPLADARPPAPVGAAAASVPPIPSMKDIGRNATSMEHGMTNQLLAAKQFTSPYVGEHKKNFIGDATIDEEDNVWYKDPEGKPQKTDSSKHVVLIDPEDGKHKVFTRSKDTDEGPIKGRLLGAGHIISQGLAGGQMPMASSPTIATKAIAAAKRLEDTTGVGVTVPRTAVTESGIRQRLGKFASYIPGGSGPFIGSAENMSEGLGSATKALSEGTAGVETTAESAGAAARAGVTEYVKPHGGLARKVSDAYDKVDDVMTKQGQMFTPAPKSLDNTRSVAQTIMDERAAAKLEGTPKYVQMVENAVTDPQGLTYAGLKKLRTHVGQELEGAAGTDRTDLKRLYKGLTQDMEGLLKEQGGPQALKAWERATKYAELAAGRRDKLATVLGAEGRGDEGIFGKIVTLAGDTTTANAKLLDTVRKAVSPSEWGEIASGVVGRLGFKRMGDAEVFDPSKFLKDYGKLSNKGKAILFGENGELRKSLDAIVTLAERWPQLKSVAHPSGEFSHIVTTAGIFHHGMKAIETLFGARAVASILSRPNTARYAARWIQSAEQLRLAPTPATVTAFNNASRVFANEAAGELRQGVDHTTQPARNVAATLAASLIGLAGTLHEFGHGK